MFRQPIPLNQSANFQLKIVFNQSFTLLVHLFFYQPFSFGQLSGGHVPSTNSILNQFRSKFLDQPFLFIKPFSTHALTCFLARLFNKTKTGGKPALHPVQGEGRQPAQRALVLQERGAKIFPNVQ